MKIFCTGATGYIGGSVATTLVKNGHEITGFVRTELNADKVRAQGMIPVLGSLDDNELLTKCAKAADAIVNAANADDDSAANVLLESLKGTGKTFLHTSGSSIVGTQSKGQKVDDVYDEETPLSPSPARAARVALNQQILSYKNRGVRTIIICPSLIYGLGMGVAEHSMQVPWLLKLAKKQGIARHYGPGENIWSNVHIKDLVDLYQLALEGAHAGAFYYAENGENSMKEICEAINRMLGVEAAPSPMSLDEATEEWGAGPAQNTMGSNSRVRAVRARQELNWKPAGHTLISEIEQGCYKV